MRVSIIGSGIAGLASAVRMANRGYEVDVFEANSYPGGKLSSFHQDGYRFDAGPSLFTMPQYVDELFTVAGKEARQHFTYTRLDTVCNYFWDDGTRLSAFADPEKWAAEVESTLGVPKQDLQQILRDSAHKYNVCGRIFLEKSLHKPATWLNWSVLKAMFQIPGLDLFSTMHATNRRMAKHDKLVQLLDRFATYNGSNPYRTPGLMTIIPHFEQYFGAFLPKGGMVAITEAVYQLGADLGVRYHFDTPVTQIRLEKKKAIGVETKDAFYPADAVISNMDVFHVYEKLMPGQAAPARILNQERSNSALIFYWGIKKSFPELDLHNIFFSEDYKAEFDAIEAGKVCADPTVYVNITSKLEPADAPEGCENWFVMINVPADSGQDWDAIILEARVNIQNKLSAQLDIDLKSLIENESILDPRSIASRTQSHRGALYGTSSNSQFSAFLRHPNFHAKIENVFFCGGSAHPGGGIPLCLLSAKIVDEVMHS